MRKIKVIVSALIISGLLQACAGVGIVATSDPQVKLSDARHLFIFQNRPLPAERLIREAITICEKNADQDCLAEAYLAYGYFFRSNSVQSWEKVYRRDGFLDRTVTFDDRFEKSKEYIDKAKPLIDKSKAYDMQTNAYLNFGEENEKLGLQAEACEMYAKSLVANEKNLETNPNAKVILPDGYSSYAEYLSGHQKRAGCVE
jgi:tetratricopeptide (TPR) repeat protein